MKRFRLTLYKYYAKKVLIESRVNNKSVVYFIWNKLRLVVKHWIRFYPKKLYVHFNFLDKIIP